MKTVSAKDSRYGNERQDYEVILSIPILHKGWELDNTIYIAKNKGGEIVFIQSSHGGLYLVEKEEFLKDIQEKKEEYQAAIKIFDAAFILSEDQPIDE